MRKEDNEAQNNADKGVLPSNDFLSYEDEEQYTENDKYRQNAKTFTGKVRKKFRSCRNCNDVKLLYRYCDVSRLLKF